MVNGTMAWVKVLRWPTLATADNKLTTALCVKPLHNSFNRAVWLVEFIEMYQILGVSYFVFYNHSVRKGLGGLRYISVYTRLDPRWRRCSATMCSKAWPLFSLGSCLSKAK